MSALNGSCEKSRAALHNPHSDELLFDAWVCHSPRVSKPATDLAQLTLHCRLPVHHSAPVSPTATATHTPPLIANKAATLNEPPTSASRLAVTTRPFPGSRQPTPRSTELCSHLCSGHGHLFSVAAYRAAPTESGGQQRAVEVQDWRRSRPTPAASRGVELPALAHHRVDKVLARHDTPTAILRWNRHIEPPGWAEEEALTDGVCGS
jgi:hypothetical protein